MPRLSQQTLEKRFQCPHCGVTVRTRQGLSGHIQYKHPKGSVKKPASIIEAANGIKNNEKFYKSMGMSDAQIADLTMVSREWVLITALMEDEKFKLNDNDFKTFQLMAYAILASEKRLKNWMTHEFSEEIAKLMKPNAEIASGII